jgi:hypothetical protein
MRTNIKSFNVSPFSIFPNKKIPISIAHGDFNFYYILNVSSSEVENIKYYIFSITKALAPPPPLQIAAPPNLALFCFNTLINVTITRAPEQPNG